MINELNTRPFIFDQLLEAQKARNELMKWKLIIVSAIGSAGLGFFKTDGTNQLYLIILFVPIASVYVDLLCRNLSIRSLRINMFASSFPEIEGTSFDIKYLKFYQDTRADLGASLESIALIWSTVLITFIVSGIGITISPAIAIKGLFSFCGLACLILSIFVEGKYNAQKRIILTRANGVNNSGASSLKVDSSTLTK